MLKDPGLISNKMSGLFVLIISFDPTKTSYSCPSVSIFIPLTFSGNLKLSNLILCTFTLPSELIFPPCVWYPGIVEIENLAIPLSLEAAFKWQRFGSMSFNLRSRLILSDWYNKALN